MNACNMLWHNCVDAQAALKIWKGSQAFDILSWEFIFGLFWFLLIRPAVCHGLPDYVKRKVESIREEHYSIPSLLFRWTQQSDE